jgi:DNA-binding NtrC family response regulator
MPDSLNTKRVLILEDEPVITKVLSRTLKFNGFTVDTAENGVTAQEKIDAGETYDLLVFDIKTPVVSGIQLYEHLEKEHPELTDKVIIMTGDCLNTSTNLFLERVKRPVVSKPFTPDQMLDEINRLLEQQPATV